MIPKELNDWLQVLGLFGVLGGLVFVGLQLKQSQEIAIGSQYSERAFAGLEYWQYIGSQPRTLGRVGANHRDHLEGTSIPDDLTDEEIGQIYVNQRVLIIAWDNIHFQYESGFITEEGWSPFRNQIRNGCIAGSPVDAVLKNHGQTFRASFVEYCLQNRDDL